jgi:flagellar FliL protein
VFGGEEQTSPEGANAAEAAKPHEPTFWALSDMVVSLNAPDRKTRYLKIRTTLELASPNDVDAVAKMAPRIVDFCQTYLRELRPEELRGSVAIVRLREELLRRINLAVAPVTVRDVLFTDIFIE